MPDNRPNDRSALNRPAGLDTNAIQVFVSVVKAKSFVQAARTLGMPTSTVSDRVSQLEQQLGVTLIHRTTRKLNLTEIGNEFFAQAEAGMSQLQVAAERATQARSTPRGTLRITAPVDINHQVVAQAVAEYRRKCPEVGVELHLTNRYVDLIVEGFDLAVRGGRLPDSGLKAKRLGTGSLILVASLEYLKRTKAPRVPQDLAEHRCLRFLSSDISAPAAAWRLRAHDGRTASVRPEFLISANSFAMVIELALLGEGIGLVPETVVREPLRRRELQRVLPDWTTAEAPVHLVYPAPRQALPKVKAMIPIMQKHFNQLFTEAGA